MSQASLLVCHSTFNCNPIQRQTREMRLSAPLFLEPFLSLSYGHANNTTDTWVTMDFMHVMHKIRFGEYLEQ